MGIRVWGAVRVRKGEVQEWELCEREGDCLDIGVKRQLGIGTGLLADGRGKRGLRMK